MIAVDTNVIAYLHIQGDRTALARKLLQTDPESCAPLLWRSEFQNVLATYIRQKFMTVTVATDLAEAAQAQLVGRECTPGSKDVLSLAATSRCSAYDCEFVSVARTLKVPLISTDGKLLKSFPEDTASLEEAIERLAPKA